MKDLGAQISWMTVFVIEYVSMTLLYAVLPLRNASCWQIGPLIVHPLVYHFPKLFYGRDVQHSLLQKYVSFWNHPPS